MNKGATFMPKILFFLFQVSCIQRTYSELIGSEVDYVGVTKLQIDYIKSFTDEERRGSLKGTTKLETPANKSGSLGGERGVLKFNEYLRFHEINSYFDRLAETYPKVVQTKVAGKSSEGRKIKAIHISHGGPESDVIAIIGGLHAHEWLSPASALYIVHHLVEKSGKIESFLKNFTWIILPLANPDGYEYSHTSQRMWRKTRSPQKWGCYGVDANRNFGFHWDEQTLGQNPCDEAFRGKKPFTEPETRVVANLLDSAKGRCTLFIDLHSFGGFIFLPWTYTEKRISTYDELKAIGLAGAKAIYKATGTRFQVGSLPELLYTAGGSAIDYAMGELGIPYALSLELRGGGPTGFDPPPSKIKGVANEAWIGIKAMAEKHQTSIRKFGVKNCSGIQRESILYYYLLIIFISM